MPKQSKKKSTTSFKPKVKRTPSQIGKTNRRKGHQFERDIAILLRPLFPNAERELEYQKSSANGVDLKNTGRYKIQAKFKQKYVNPGTIEEIKISSSGDVPVLLTKKAKGPTLAVLYFQDLLVLMKRAERPAVTLTANEKAAEQIMEKMVDNALHGESITNLKTIADNTEITVDDLV